MPQLSRLIPSVANTKLTTDSALWGGLEYYQAVAAGLIPGHSIIHKFGRHGALGTAIEPITLGGVYQTPTSAQSLEILSDSADDASGGSGAATVYIQGLNAAFEVQSETVTMDGLTPVALANTYTRLFRFYVKDSGTYATQTAGSHAGKITIRGAGGGAVWGNINDTTIFPKGQSQIASYTVPANHTAYLYAAHIHVEATKPSSLFLFRRDSANVVSPPYSSMRLVQEWDGVNGPENWVASSPIVFEEYTDLGFMGKAASQAAAVSVDFELILVENT